MGLVKSVEGMHSPKKSDPLLNKTDFFFPTLGFKQKRELFLGLLPAGIWTGTKPLALLAPWFSVLQIFPSWVLLTSKITESTLHNKSVSSLSLCVSLDADTGIDTDTHTDISYRFCFSENRN